MAKVCVCGCINVQVVRKLERELHAADLSEGHVIVLKLTSSIVIYLPSSGGSDIDKLLKRRRRASSLLYRDFD